MKEQKEKQMKRKKKGKKKWDEMGIEKRKSTKRTRMMLR